MWCACIATPSLGLSSKEHCYFDLVFSDTGLEVVLDEGKTGNMLVGPTVVETLFRFHKVSCIVHVSFI